MRDRNCPGCGQPIYRNHHCRASVLHDPPCPPPANLRELIEQARREAAAPVVEPLTLPIEETP